MRYRGWTAGLVLGRCRGMDESRLACVCSSYRREISRADPNDDVVSAADFQQLLFDLENSADDRSANGEFRFTVRDVPMQNSIWIKLERD